MLHGKSSSYAMFQPPDKHKGEIVTTSWDGVARIWQIKNAVLLGTFNVSENSFFLVHFCLPENHFFSTQASTKVAIWGGDKKVSILPLKVGLPEIIIQGHTDRIAWAQFNKQGDKIVTASWDGTAKIWKVEDGLLLITLKGHTENLNSACFNERGDKVVTASWDGTAKIWQVEKGSLLVTLAGHKESVVSAQFNKQGDKVVTASCDGTSMIWQAKWIPFIYTKGT